MTETKKRNRVERVLSFEDSSPLRESFRSIPSTLLVHCCDRIKMRIRKLLASLIRIYCDRSVRINLGLIGGQVRGTHRYFYFFSPRSLFYFAFFINYISPGLPRPFLLISKRFYFCTSEQNIEI